MAYPMEFQVTAVTTTQDDTGLVFILEELEITHLRTGVTEHRKAFLWVCPTDRGEVPIDVRRGIVWNRSLCPQCGRVMSKRRAQRALNEAFAHERRERDAASHQPLTFEELPMSSTNETMNPFASTPTETITTPKATVTTAPPDEPLTFTQKAGALAKSTGSAVWNTVYSVSFGAGIIVGAGLLWGVAELARHYGFGTTTPTDQNHAE